MGYTDGAFVTMLLTMALSPDKEEYARPLSVSELNRIRGKAADSGERGLGCLLNVDISGLMLKLDIPEEEAYRIYTLLNRNVQLSYAIEGFLDRGIEVKTIYGEDYPERLKARMKENAPPVFYFCGNSELLHKPMLSVIGIRGVRTTPEVREGVEALVREGVRNGYTIVTGGELGVSRAALTAAGACGGTVLEILGGELETRIAEPEIASLLEAGRGAVLSTEHPGALFTIPHAITRNKLIFALSEAAFIFNTDGKRGEADALRNRYCDWIYAMPGNEKTDNLIARGAIAMPVLTTASVGEMIRRWDESASEQLNMFDILM